MEGLVELDFFLWSEQVCKALMGLVRGLHRKETPGGRILLCLLAAIPLHHLQLVNRLEADTGIGSEVVGGDGELRDPVVGYHIDEGRRDNDLFRGILFLEY